MKRLFAAAFLLCTSAALAADVPSPGVPVIIHGRPAPMPANGYGQDSGTPAYAPDGKLLFPADYREWIYLSTDFDLSYSDSVTSGSHVFGNVFVNRDAYAAFRNTGAWPDKTMLVLELRGAGADNPLNKRGQYQAGGAPMGLEMHVKDAAKGGWNFYEFNPAHAPAAPLAKTAACFACHQKNGVTDTTFTQFYPTLAEPAAK